MNDKFLLDINILIYTFDSREPAKQQRANELVIRALKTRQGIISFQVVQECLNAARRKFASVLSPLDVQTYLVQVLTPLCQVFSSIDLYVRALEIAERWQYSFYDSLIIATALQANCQILYSEDLQHGQVIQSLTIINPFLNKS
jgi:predicted nucleic acid-binding protein